MSGGVWFAGYFPKDVAVDNTTNKQYLILQISFWLNLYKENEKNMTDLFTYVTREVRYVGFLVSYIIMESCANVCWKSNAEKGKI